MRFLKFLPYIFIALHGEITLAVDATNQLNYKNYSATLLKNGDVLIAGGQLRSKIYKTALLYHPDTNTWSNTGSMNKPRDIISSCTTLLKNNQVLAAGGDGLRMTPLFGKNSELYNPVTGRWTPTAFLHADHGAGQCITLPSGQVFIAGGMDEKGAELYNPVTGRWTLLEPMQQARAQFGMALLQNKKILIVGGQDDILTENVENTAELYNLTTHHWEPAASMSVKRYDFSTTLLPNGKVLVAGGSSFDAEYNPLILNSAELYDPNTNTWTSTGAMQTLRASHHATLLNNGLVLVTGGIGGSTASNLNSSELYDPATGLWTTTTNNMGAIKGWHTATLLPNGKVLATAPKNKLKLYDPTTNRWSSTE